MCMYVGPAVDGRNESGHGFETKAAFEKSGRWEDTLACSYQVVHRGCGMKLMWEWGRWTCSSR